MKKVVGLVSVSAISFVVNHGIAWGSRRIEQSGIASIYATTSKRSDTHAANGERVHPHALTAAHRKLPFGTKVRVTNRKNGRSVVVRINDRGPFIRGRIIDLTPAGARALSFSGLAPVTINVIE